MPYGEGAGCQIVPRLFLVETLRKVVVHGPAAVGDDVREIPTFRLDVQLGEEVVAHEAAALPFAGKEADPVQDPVVRAMVAPVLDVVPDAESDLEELVAELLLVVDGVIHAADFEPPEILVAGHGMAAFGQFPVVIVAVGPGRRNECLWPVGLARLDQAGKAHGPFVGLFRGDRLAELVPALAAHAELRAGHGPDHAVPGAVGEQARAHDEAGLRGHLVSGYGDDPAFFRLDLVDVRVEEQDEVFLEARLLVEDGIPHRVVGVAVAVGVIEEDLFYNTRLVVVRPVGTADPHADLAGGVTPEHRPVVDKGGPAPVPGRFDRGRKARQAASDHAEVYVVNDIPHDAAPRGARPP